MRNQGLLEDLIETFDHWKDLPEIARSCSVPYYVQDGIEAIWYEIKKVKEETMDPAQALALVMIGRMLFLEGIPAVAKAIQEWQKKDPTLTDYQALLDNLKHPSEYVKKEGG